MQPITAAILEAKGACEDQVKMFAALEKAGAISMTVETAVLFADRFDWDWAAKNLLPAPLWKAYEEAAAPLWNAYREAEAPLWKAYREAAARLFAELYISQE